MAFLQAVRPILRGATILVLAAIFWVVLAYLASAPLGMIYGWSGHPPMPRAPKEVYIGLFLVVLPVFSLAVAWLLVRAVRGLLNRRRA